MRCVCVCVWVEDRKKSKEEQKAKLSRFARDVTSSQHLLDGNCYGIQRAINGHCRHLSLCWHRHRRCCLTVHAPKHSELKLFSYKFRFHRCETNAKTYTRVRPKRKTHTDTRTRVHAPKMFRKIFQTILMIWINWSRPTHTFSKLLNQLIRPILT